MSPISGDEVRRLAACCGFDLAGVAPAVPLPEFGHYRRWVAEGMAGAMSYLTDQRGEMRGDPRTLLPSARSVICVGKLYNTREPYSIRFHDPERGWISRYAWGEDYHEVVRRGLEQLADRLRQAAGRFEWRISVDTAPLLERGYARRAGLGWIGRNTCLINQRLGSWVFLGALLVSLEIEPDTPPPDRCGSCRRCVEACPTRAIVPLAERDQPEARPAWAVDARRCISYLTIELRGAIPEELQGRMGNHVFGCDICQDVCPWNRRAPVTGAPAFAARHFAPRLDDLEALREEEFRRLFRGSPVERVKHQDFLRNVAIARGNRNRMKLG